MLKVSPFETYQHYLSLKNHFTNPKYDFFKYGAKTRASVTSFNKRKDKYWFEKTSRKYSDKEVVDFLVSKPLKEKLKWDATRLNFMKRTSRARLPL